MAKKRSKSREKASLNLGEIDRFLDDASSTPENRNPSSAPSAPKAAPDAEPTPESTDAEADPTLPEAEPPRALSIDIPDDGLLAIIRAINPDTTLEFVLVMPVLLALTLAIQLLSDALNCLAAYVYRRDHLLHLFATIMHSPLPFSYLCPNCIEIQQFFLFQ